MRELIVNDYPKSSVTEAIKAVRTNLRFSSINDKIKTILVTSSVAGEGKSFVSANLASTFATSTEKVLLIQDKINNREIDKEDAWDLLSDICGLDSYESFKLQLDRQVAAHLYNGYQLFNRADYNIDIDDELDEEERDEFSREEIIIN